ncbi:alpha/beta hydrolase [Butyrivibrio sp. DSM 10294]|uniref:alpha/beta hydrolase n=1 Tax=Butyrivibrio sp. DSM 10294 TaxID=2972457 RepID=UPI00234F3022|nr:alpha/beta hydrolase [Butyrivibrio sp. DSM 10294]MDC7292309.1 alpha/beta hydrolase [Butyrivibrio sp. DSM 10294]
MIIAVIITVLIIAVAYALAAYAVRGKRCSLEETAEIERKDDPQGAAFIGKGTPYTINGYEGYVLHAEHIKSECGDGKHFVILTHGFSSTRHGALKYVPIFIKRGYDCIIYDLRGHGENLFGDSTKMPARIGRKHICTFSKKECRDLLCVIRDTRERYGKDILLGLHGESLGAASTISALRYKPDVAFAVEDCGFADIINVQKVGLKNMHLPPFLVYFASVAAGIIYGYFFTSVKPETAITDNEVPLLIMHGEADDFIVPDNARRIYEAQKGYKRIELFEGAGHAMSRFASPDRYEQIVNEFLDEQGF